MNNVAVVDGDLYRYSAAFVGEKRSVNVIHKQSGRVLNVPTRTDWYGDWRKKEGGMLARINKSKGTSFSWDDFEYEDVQIPEPIENVLHTAKVMVEKDIRDSGADKYIFYMGEGDSFRVEKSTILEYKGNRTDLIKPLCLDEVTEYLRKKFKAIVVSDIECDDAVVMECFKKKDHFAIIEDKDFWGCPINVWDRNQQDRGIVNCNKFGHLFIDPKGKVRGEGRIFLWWQIAAKDAVDNYAANSASDMKWADKSAYNALVDCKNDKQAVESLIKVYKKLYPEPKEITGWRGDKFTIDWKYVLNENFQMARMLRYKGDNVVIDDVFNNLGISPE